MANGVHVNRSAEERVRVLIVGGGVAAVEALLAMRALAGNRVELTVLSAQRELRVPARDRGRGVRSW